MITHQIEGFLYPYTASHMLSHFICEIFAKDDLALQLSGHARMRATDTHDRKKNLSRLMEIYADIQSPA